MSYRPPTDVQLARALAAHLPAAAPTGLRERVMLSVEKTAQQRRLPALVLPLLDGGPIARRRNLLIAAALLLALALAGAAAVGSLLQRQRHDLSLEPPADIAGYVDAAYLGLADLPAFEMIALETGDRHKINSNGKGAIRDERVSTNVTRIVSSQRAIQMSVDPEGRRTWIDLGRSDVVPGLEVGRYMRLDSRCPDSASYVSLDYVLGRPTHHVRCGTIHFWIDVEFRLVLRSAFRDPIAVPSATGSGTGPSAEPSAGAASAALSQDWEVVELRFGPQREELFSFEPPAGFSVVRADDPACLLVWFATCHEPGTSGRPPQPYVTPRPAPGESGPPTDVDALVAAVRAAYAQAPALEMVIEGSNHVLGDANLQGEPGRSHHFADGTGRFRTELSDKDRTTYITTRGHIWISYRQADGSILWLDRSGVFADHGGVADIMLGFPDGCDPGWRSIGVEIVRDRPAEHLSCATEDYWVDLERFLIVRAESHPADPLGLVSGITEVVEIHFEHQPEALFELPAGALVSPSPAPRP